MGSNASPPLQGIRVLDLSRVLPGPFASMMLADLGAEVIKIEHPAGGDLERSGEPKGAHGEAYRFGMLNRNKRSIAVNLKADEGRGIVQRLARDADVVLEGFRPGVAEELGVGPAALRAINPGLVYASISGYGQDGPYAELPGHDINYMAMAGLLRYFGDDEGPRVPWLPIADIGGGAAMAVAGVLAALIRRAATGEGDFLDLGMAEGALWFRNAEENYQVPQDKLRQRLNLAAIERKEGRKDLAIRDLRAIADAYGSLPEATAAKGWLDILDPPAPPPATPKQ